MMVSETLRGDKKLLKINGCVLRFENHARVTASQLY